MSRNRTTHNRLMRRAGVAVAAGALLTGVAVYGTASAAEESAAQPPSAQNQTLREAAQSSGRFVGTAIADHRLNDSTYTAIASREFSSVTAENEMKWESVEPNRGQYNWGGADRFIAFAQQNNQQTYGHTLVWHSQMPGWLENGNFSATELNQIMHDHIATYAGRYAGQIDRWDVVNEAFNEDGTFRNSKWLQVLGEDYIADAFRAARQADPNAKLFINDYNTDGINAKSNGMYQLVQRLQQQGVPIDGVGFQSHMILGQMPGDYQQNLQRFADLGLEVVVTELDIRMDMPSNSSKLEQQARQYTSVTEACLAVSRCSGITVWGFGDRDSWVPDWFEGQGAANLYDDNYQPKPAYYAMREAFGGDGDGGSNGGGDNGGGDNGGGDNGGTGGTDPVGDCSADLQINRWNAGSVVEVRVTSQQALNGWEVTFDLPSGSVTQSWNAEVSQSGNRVTARNLGYNGNIGAGGSLSFGFQTNSGDEYATPRVSLNGTACAGS
ncbi:endo-1,4-beta-xylanase [Streptomyces sp. ACA25]|uniref:endo-1,4-beta-xylanase n=1 Tax=Streptomyces sp. ACA25 TaxID=3022596 RepID=UPI0023076120|nr:endo-1,4-beta-xylanase [Streptomyces sp. ACA25]MDB1088262.1 endo-1,4-beta-xylanase [Streptomyces sp. ACA25]